MEAHPWAPGHKLLSVMGPVLGSEDPIADEINMISAQPEFGRLVGDIAK